MDNKLDINVTEKIVSDENILKTVEEALMKNELCLFMSETGTFMTTGTTDDAEEIFLKLQSVLLAGFLSMEKATDLFMIKARQYYRNSIKVDDITYTQMKAIFDILGIDTEEVLK